MTVGELSAIVSRIAKRMGLPVLRVIAVSDGRQEPYVSCEIQTGKETFSASMTIKLSEIKLLPGLNTLTFVDGNEDLIVQRLTEAARKAKVSMGAVA